MNTKNGFTLIELSIVLVIIGLLVGGVLVGRDLIKAAEIRAQISQIDKFQSAVNTFKLKYNALPGDIPAYAATAFGFGARGVYRGQGDGNGLIEGVSSNADGVNGFGYQSGGETAMFWVDMSAANLVEGSFNTANALAPPGGGVAASGLGAYYPSGKIQGTYGYVWTDYANNYFGIVGIASITAFGGTLSTNLKIPVIAAYTIDNKVDDGYPQSGRVNTWYVTGTSYFWARTASNLVNTTATPGSSTTCFDNGNTAGVAQQYSVGQSGGNNLNCALSFKMQ